jgi:hypothetical protein
MKGCIYNTSSRWIEFLREQRITDDVNFWRKDKRHLNLEPGAPFYFKQLGADVVIGRGVFREIANMTVAEAWSRFATRNGYANRTDFFAGLPAVLQLAEVDGHTPLSCIVLDQLEWLPSPTPLAAGAFPQGIMGAKYFEVEDLRYLDDAFSPESRERDPAPIVLVENEATLGGAYDHWADRTGEVYHFPNQYRGRMIEGRRFVYYRGVRREGNRRGAAEYFGCGRIGTTWRDDSQAADTPKNRRRWFSAIEDYTPFALPVAASQEDRYLETVTNPRDWGIGVRPISEEIYREILALAGVEAQALTIVPAAMADAALELTSDLLRIRRAAAEGPPPAGFGVRTARRSRRAAAIGRAAEELVFRHLQRTHGEDRVRWHARDGELPGYDLSYRLDGLLQAVEVKGTVGGVFPSVELTINEWNQAEALRERFWLYLVADCGTAHAKLQVIRDPYGVFARGLAGVSPVVIRFELHGAIDDPARSPG